MWATFCFFGWVLLVGQGTQQLHARIDDLLHSLSHAEAADELEMTDLGPEPPGTEGTEGATPGGSRRGGFFVFFGGGLKGAQGGNP